MSARSDRTRRGDQQQAQHLVEAMTGSSALPAFVPRIDPRTLKKLVDELGIEDSGALVAHASSRQIAHLLDETIWSGARPGDPERLSVAELLRWLDLWNGVGSRFAADKLYELGADFVSVAFSRLLIVADYDLAPRVLDEHTQPIGNFLVRTRVEDEWDTVQTTVNALWSDYPDFTERVFGRLAFRHSTLRMFGEDDTAQVLDADAGHEHEQSRESSGFVTSVMAGAFLRSVAESDVDELAGETAYDLATEAYFRRRAALSSAVADEPDAETPAGTDPGAGKSVHPADEGAGAEAEEELIATELAALEGELRAYEREQHRPVALLEGPAADSSATAEAGPSGSAADGWVKLALTRLQSQPEVFDARMDELTYLANLLIAGAEMDGDRLDASLAANLALATSNLGAGHEQWLETGADDPVDAVVAALTEPPGLVRLFRIGWQLIAGLPVQAASRLKEVFADELVREQLAVKPWVLTEVDALLGQPDLAEAVRAGEYDDARETLKILGIALEPEAVVALCVLTDGVPRFARVLDSKPPEGAVVTLASRHLATMQDLLMVHRFLDHLPEQVRM